MGEDVLRYDRMVEAALKGVVRETLRHVAEHGLSGNHPLNLTFKTRDPGVELPGYLAEQYPDQMTIILQHQFWGLEVRDDAFQVTLSFNKAQERLTVPFAAITRFTDPAAQFDLQFEAPRPARAPEAARPGEPETPAAASEEATPAPEKSAEIVALDAFREK